MLYWLDQRLNKSSTIIYRFEGVIALDLYERSVPIYNDSENGFSCKGRIAF